jgi:hypothetical protein
VIGMAGREEKINSGHGMARMEVFKAASVKGRIQTTASFSRHPRGNQCTITVLKMHPFKLLAIFLTTVSAVPFTTVQMGKREGQTDQDATVAWLTLEAQHCDIKS